MNSTPTHALRIQARMNALNFVLAHGEAISDDAEALTHALSTTLLTISAAYAETNWFALEAYEQHYVLRQSAEYILTDLLTQLNRRSNSRERFLWRNRFCRFLLGHLYPPPCTKYSRVSALLIERFALVAEPKHLN